MANLKKLCQETGLSKTLFCDIAGVSTNSLRKYERSGADHMRKTTVDRIETAARLCEEHLIEVIDLHFGNGRIIRTDNDRVGYTLESSWYHTGIRVVRGMLGINL